MNNDDGQTQPVVARFIEHRTTICSDESEHYSLVPSDESEDYSLVPSDESEDYSSPRSPQICASPQPVVARFIEHRTTICSDESE